MRRGGHPLAETQLRTLEPQRFGSTVRRDAWWLEILPVIIVLGGFGLYATLRAFEDFSGDVPPGGMFLAAGWKNLAGPFERNFHVG